LLLNQGGFDLQQINKELQGNLIACLLFQAIDLQVFHHDRPSHEVLPALVLVLVIVHQHCDLFGE
jgi:hypothetical protein